MMNTYLTLEEIADIKAIKAQYIKESDFKELKAYLKKNGYEITIYNSVNKGNTFKAILDSFPDSVINHPAHIKYKNENPNVGFSGKEKTFVVNGYLYDLDSKLDKLYDLAYSLDFDNAIRLISQKTDHLQGFDTISFILNTDYDFKPFSIESIDKTLIENTKAIEKVVNKWFESFTKELNTEQKSILSKNLFQTVNLFVKNSNTAQGFKTLLEYTSNQSD